jgi:hypothetical protein
MESTDNLNLYHLQLSQLLSKLPSHAKSVTEYARRVGLLTPVELLGAFGSLSNLDSGLFHPMGSLVQKHDQSLEHKGVVI